MYPTTILVELPPSVVDIHFNHIHHTHMDLPNATTGTSATWNYHGGRTITVEHELAPGLGFTRPTRVHGRSVIITPAPVRDRTLRPCAIQDQELWNNYKENSFEGGHLLALSLGGPDHHFNIVPMNKGANGGSGVWGRIESAIRQSIKGSVPKRTDIDLRITYSDMIDPYIPHRVVAYIGGLLRFDLEIRPPSDSTNLMTRQIRRLFRDIRELAGDYGMVPTSKRPHIPLDVIDFDDDDSQDIRDRIRLIPLLADYPRRGIDTTGSGRVVPVQRRLMMLHNRFNNDGLLMAEDPLNLGFMLNEWRVQADHILPYSQGGTREYRNLRLLHHRTNNRRGAGAVGGGGKVKRVRRATMRYSPY